MFFLCGSPLRVCLSSFSFDTCSSPMERFPFYPRSCSFQIAASSSVSALTLSRLPLPLLPPLLLFLDCCFLFCLRSDSFYMAVCSYPSIFIRERKKGGASRGAYVCIYKVAKRRPEGALSSISLLIYKARVRTVVSCKARGCLMVICFI